MPGWTVLGDSGYSGYAWYRLKVNVQYDPGLSAGGLEIKMPDDVDDAYQVFVDGQMIRRIWSLFPEGRKDVPDPAARVCHAQWDQERTDHNCDQGLDGSVHAAHQS